MKIELTRAQLGLVATTLLEKLVDDGEQDYEIVPTGEKATLSECVKIFCDEIISLGGGKPQ
jgi:hypothetical protein